MWVKLFQHPDWQLAALLILVSSVFYLAMGLGKPAYYDYFDPLARAFLQGHWWLDQPDPLLHELIACGDGRWCVVYVPVPAFFVLPFTLVLPAGVAQQVASSLAGSLSALPLFLAMRALGASKGMSVMLVLLGLFGTSLYFASIDGRAWFFAHAVGFFFASMALWLALSKRPLYLVALCIGLAALARVPYALAVPGLIWLCSGWGGRGWKVTLLQFSAVLLPLVLLESGYSLLRWGVPWERGYTDLASTEAFYPYGIFSLSYLPRHLYAIFLQAPEFAGSSLLVLKPTWVGVSVVFMSPAFFFLIPSLRYLRASPVGPLWLCATLVFIPDLLHGNVGWTQLGYRFWIDPLPFFLPLLAFGVSGLSLKRKPSLTWKVLWAWSLVVTFYFTFVVRHLDYVEMRFPPL